MSINTVFIIGAGASKEVGLPIGKELLVEISQLLSYVNEGGDRLLWDALQMHPRRPDNPGEDINAYVPAIKSIRRAIHLESSIDNFIYTHRENEKIALCGKLAIARAILRAEAKSYLWFEYHEEKSEMNFEKLVKKKTWYPLFFEALNKNCNKVEIIERLKSITFIIFNYDRCIEHFLFHSLKKYYELSDTETAKLMECINIYHPFGAVGTLPWANQSDATEYGEILEPEKLLELAKNIKTVTEATDMSVSETSEIRECMRRAECIYFLGFAFHELNMALIKPETPIQLKKCFATTKGFSKDDENFIRAQFDNLFRPRQYSEFYLEKSCYEFFDHFKKSLVF